MFITADQVLAHAVGDYILQSHWMASEKTKRSLAAYDAAMEAVRLAKLHADSLRMEFTQIQSRALQRAKYQQLRAEQRAEQPSELQKAEG